MADVVLIGDSIRMGYEAAVSELLDGIAQVWAPEANGRHSGFVRENLMEWVVERAPDVVHINAGLHDLARFEDGKHQIPIEEYRINIPAILRTVLDNTAATLIWATTTPVHDGRLFQRHGRQHRIDADVVQYNDVAIKSADGLGVPVNDLYGYVQGAGVEELLSDDGVHFTEEGSAALAQVVADCIEGFLP